MVVGKFDDLPALGADQVIVMPAEMTMFIPDRLPVKLLFPGKSQFNHPVHALGHKHRIKRIALFFQKMHHLLEGDMCLGSKKNINDIESFLNPVRAVFFYKGLEIGLFQIVGMCHMRTILKMRFIADLLMFSFQEANKAFDTIGHKRPFSILRI